MPSTVWTLSNTMVVTTIFFFLLKCFVGPFKATSCGKRIDINVKMLSRDVKMSTHQPKVVSTIDHLVILQICKEITARFSLSVCVLEVLGWINYLYCKRCSCKCY